MTPDRPAVTLDELVADELKSIELADIEHGIEDIRQLTVYLASLAHAAYTLGAREMREQIDATIAECVDRLKLEHAVLDIAGANGSAKGIHEVIQMLAALRASEKDVL